MVTATIAPSLVEDLGGIAYINWTISLYEVGAILAGAAAGAIGTRVGIKQVFIGATLVYGAGCVLAAVSFNIALLIGGRFIQDVGGRMLMALCYCCCSPPPRSSCIVRCADPTERALASASVSTIQRIGYAVGSAAVGVAANLSGLAEAYPFKRPRPQASGCSRPSSRSWCWESDARGSSRAPDQRLLTARGALPWAPRRRT